MFNQNKKSIRCRPLKSQWNIPYQLPNRGDFLDHYCYLLIYECNLDAIQRYFPIASLRINFHLSGEAHRTKHFKRVHREQAT